jgi:hypothetical protein
MSTLAVLLIAISMHEVLVATLLYTTSTRKDSGIDHNSLYVTNVEPIHVYLAVCS